jgi:hypothetical protein
VKPHPTRTINPLHFEDLEPHRFEDLVRQLVYGFRSWVMLEPLGRSGADAGIDIRGIERLSPPARPHEATDEVDDGDERNEERTWFIQCKREKAFGPAKARAVAEAALAGAADAPHGFLLAAPCDLSKQTRDTLASELRSVGVREVVAWGRGDLEDLLYLPENDHLLFAYFGMSLQVRRRNQTTELRSRLARKRQVFRAVGDLEHRGWTPVLVRDPSEPGYPFRERVENWDEDNPPWRWAAFRQHSNPDTLALIFERHHAWISKSRKSYDVVDSCSHVIPHRNGFDKVPDRDEEACERVWRFFHNEIPRDERAWLETVGWIRLDDILLVDDLGDIFNEPPHVLVTREHKYGFFGHVRQYLELDRHDTHERLDPDELRRVNLFPDPIPDVEWKREW